MVIRERVEEKITAPQDLVGVMEAILRAEHEIDQMREHFWVIGADVQNYISYIELVSLGILNRALVHPREVFRLAIMKGVARIFCCHNHPSGCPDPSKEDNAVTDKLRNAGEILGIELLDHIIIGEKRYYSYMEEGKLITGEEKGDRIMEEAFEIIHSYTRSEAIQDGFLVDLTALYPKDTKLYKYPVACTRNVWSLIESACKETGEDPGAYVWDLCNMAIHCGRSIDAQTKLFVCNVPLREGCERKFKIQCGPGDNMEPVLTIMFPDED